MFTPQQRGELILSDTATETCTAFAKPGMFQHFGQKARLQLAGDIAQRRKIGFRCAKR